MCFYEFGFISGKAVIALNISLEFYIGIWLISIVWLDQQNKFVHSDPTIFA